MQPIPLLAPAPVAFPDPRSARDEPDGLVAAGGALTPAWLIEAYSRGIFPWFDSDDDHILWWSPSERAVLVPGQMRVTRSLAKRVRNAGFLVSLDTRFHAVIEGCAGPRRDGGGTWITAAMRTAYGELHDLGFAHSVEIWRETRLVGGLYGIALGRMFFGESMFSVESDASKCAFYFLQQWLEAHAYSLIDCQLMNPHLARLGVSPMPRDTFLNALADNARYGTRGESWRLSPRSITL